MLDKEEMLLNILIIGNGFDLAHGLPTKYEHFLKYVEVYKCFRTFSPPEFAKESEELVNLGQDFMCHFATMSDNNRVIFREIDKMVSDNALLGLV